MSAKLSVRGSSSAWRSQLYRRPWRLRSARPVIRSVNDFDKIVADCMRLGCRLVRIGMMPFSALASREALLDFCRRSNEMAARLADQGIALYYHNHHIEFAKFDGEYILDIIRESAPLMKFELDVHWIHRGGKDPVTVLKDYAGLVDLVHLKDYRIGQLPSERLRSSIAGR